MGFLGMKCTRSACSFVMVLLATAALASLARAQSDAKPVSTASLGAYANPTVSGHPNDAALLTIRSRVNEVNVLFIATDRHGKFIRDLNQNDFTILDNHKPPQAIVNFRRETDLPLDIGLLVDMSSSVDSRFDFERTAAIGFLQHTLRPRSDKAFVVGFNSHSELAQGFTDNVELLSTSVQKLRNGGGTALYDAIYKACKDQFLKDRPDHPVRRAIVVVSDGEDNQSEVSRAQAIEMAQRAEVVVYAISTDDSGLVMRGDRVLEQVTGATGGRAFFPFKLKDITHSFVAIEDELRSQYLVSYKPADLDADGHYRPIEISGQKKNVNVRSRKGYFAPQQ